MSAHNSRQEATYGSETLQKRNSFSHSLEELKFTRQTGRERTMTKVWDLKRKTKTKKPDLLSTREAPWDSASSSIKEEILNPDLRALLRGLSEVIFTWELLREGLAQSRPSVQPSFRCQADGGCKPGTEASLGLGGERLTLTLSSQKNVHKAACWGSSRGWCNQHTRAHSISRPKAPSLPASHSYFFRGAAGSQVYLEHSFLSKWRVIATGKNALTSFRWDSRLPWGWTWL